MVWINGFWLIFKVFWFVVILGDGWLLIMGLAVCCESCYVWRCYGGGSVGLVWVFGVVLGIFLCEWWWVLVFCWVYGGGSWWFVVFVLVVAIGVVAAMVVGGYCCGSGGYASVVVDDDGDDSDRDREKVIYYFNV